MVLAEYTFGQALLTVLEVFLFAAWLMILFVIIGDLFRDHGLSGWGKAAWTVFLIFVPFLAALVYLIARSATTSSAGSSTGRRTPPMRRRTSRRGFTPSCCPRGRPPLAVRSRRSG